MDDKVYNVTLADGTVLSNLTKNGDNFISEDAIDADVFEGNCSPVVINDGDQDETHENMALIHLTQQKSGAYWFALRDLSAAELKTLQMEANIEYVAMMSGIEL